MDIERINQTPKDEMPPEVQDYPPFDPELAKQLHEQEKAQNDQESLENTDEAKMAYDPTLYSSLNEYLAAQEASKRVKIQRAERDASRGNDARRRFERDISKPDKDEFHEFEEMDAYQQNILLTAAADSLVEELNDQDMGMVDRAMFKVQEEAKETDASIFSILNRSSEGDVKNNDYGTTDLQNAFIDLTSALIMNRAETPGVGAAQGIMNKMNMLLECRIDEPNPYLDELQLDKMYVEPMVNEYLNSENRDNSANGLYRYLDEKLTVEESNLRMARRRGEDVDQDARRRVQAIKSTMRMLGEMTGDYDMNMSSIRNTAVANHWILN